MTLAFLSAQMANSLRLRANLGLDVIGRPGLSLRAAWASWLVPDHLGLVLIFGIGLILAHLSLVLPLLEIGILGITVLVLFKDQR